jgi:hypothetical protein
MRNRVTRVLSFEKGAFDDEFKKWARGTTVPTDATAGYAKGCFFMKSNGGEGTTFYINEGSETSCDFNPVTVGGGITLGDGDNLVLGTTTGTKIGTAVAQKLGFWNATPVVQPASADQAAPAAYATGAFGLDSDANMEAFYDLVVSMRTALVAAGIMKGAA